MQCTFLCLNANFIQFSYKFHLPLVKTLHFLLFSNFYFQHLELIMNLNSDMFKKVTLPNVNIY